MTPGTSSAGRGVEPRGRIGDENMPNGVTKLLNTITQSDVTRMIEEVETSSRAKLKELRTLRRLLALRVDEAADAAADGDGAEM